MKFAGTMLCILDGLLLATYCVKQNLITPHFATLSLHQHPDDTAAVLPQQGEDRETATAPQHNAPVGIVLAFPAGAGVRDRKYQNPRGEWSKCRVSWYNTAVQQRRIMQLTTTLHSIHRIYTTAFSVQPSRVSRTPVQQL